VNDLQRSAGFGGARVLLLESRLAIETAAMVRRLGGDPVSAPALAEQDVDADGAIQSFIERLRTTRAAVVVFLTGVAVTRLFATADRLGQDRALVEGLARATVVARGPKPSGALARRGVSLSRTVPEPFTTREVIATLDEMRVDDCDVTVVHYGERNESLVSHLEARGAVVRELMLYAWQLPADVTPLSRAIDALIAGEITVLAFTSQIQVRHLLDVAGLSRRDPLIAVLDDAVLVGAVGPTCAAACTAAGIRDVVAPEHPKLAPLVQALAVAHAARESRAIGGSSAEMKECR
jgi:uroporphyrinogen-III synthase